MRSAAMIVVALSACQQKAAETTTAPAASSSVQVGTVPTQASKAAEAKSAFTPAMPTGRFQRMQALGKEPFWSFEVIDKKLIYTSPETEVGVAIQSTFELDGNKMRYSGILDGKTVILVIERGTCSDGMSDTIYAYKAVFTWGEQTEQGCARLK
jgi:uncharacterized membrane protein